MAGLLSIFRKTPLSGVELRDGECRITQMVRSASGVSVTQNFVVDFGELPDDPDARIRSKADALRTALRERKLKIRDAHLCISKNKVAVRYRQLPPADNEAELEQMTHIEAERHIPFNVARHEVDYRVMAREDLAGCHVLILAVDAPVMDEAIRIFELAGVDLATADVSSCALHRLADMRVMAARQVDDAQEETTTAVVHIGERNTDIIILSRGMLVFARNANVSPPGLSGGPLAGARLEAMDALRESAGPIDKAVATPSEEAASDEVDDEGTHVLDLDRAEAEGLTGDASPEATRTPAAKAAPTPAAHPWLSRLLLELHRTYQFASREFECGPIGEVLVSGAGLQVRNIDEYLRINLEAPVRPLLDRTTSSIVAAPGATADRETLDAAALAIGVALHERQDREKPINLLPKEFLRRRKRRSQVRPLMATALLAVCAGALGILHVSNTQSQRRKTLAELETFISKNDGRRVEIAKMEKEIRIFDEFRNPKNNPLAMLDFICGLPLVGKQVRVTQFKYTQGKDLSVAGNALALKDVMSLKAELENSGFFFNVTPKSHAPRVLSHGRNVYDYELLCALRPENPKKTGTSAGSSVKGLGE